jgi:hypothetical protein
LAGPGFLHVRLRETGHAPPSLGLLGYWRVRASAGHNINGMGSEHEATTVRIAGDKLARDLQLRGPSSKDFAKLRGLTPSTLSGIIAHDNPVSAKTARRIARGLHDTPINAELAAIVADEAA